MSEFTKNKNTQPNAQEILSAGAEFIDHFEVEADPISEPEEFLRALSQFDKRYEGGRDLIRWELAADQTEWSDETKQVIMRAAESMRMLEHETPLQGHYDAVVALGGANQANLDRVRYAVEAQKVGLASFDKLIVAGSTRVLKDAERANVADYAPKAETELDCLKGAVKVIESENPGLAIEDIGVEEVLESGKKAGTPDVLEAAFKKLQEEGAIHDGSRVAAVTTQIYQASTAMDIARVGKNFGLETMAAGNPSDPKIIENRTPATYQSEVIRTLRAATLAAQAER